MKKSVIQKILLYIPAVVLGLSAMWMQGRILQNGFDGKGLLVLDNPMLYVLWGMTTAFLIGVAVLLPRLGWRGTYEDNFPACALSGAVMIAAGIVMGFTGVNLLVPGEGSRAIFAIAAGVSMAVCGLLRMLGKKPWFVLDLLIAAFYSLHLLESYSGWNADPQVQAYAFQLLAGVAVMLFSIHRARCAVGEMDRRKLVFMGFAGIFLCFAAIPGADSALVFLASGLWCAGGMCDLTHLEEPKEPEIPETAPEAGEEADELFELYKNLDFKC